MVQWEYATQTLAAVGIAGADVLCDRLAHLGDQGWELVVVLPVGRRTGSTPTRLGETLRAGRSPLFMLRYRVVHSHSPGRSHSSPMLRGDDRRGTHEDERRPMWTS